MNIRRLARATALALSTIAAGASAQAAPEFDFVALDSEMTRLLHAQNRWRYYFARNNIPVLHLTYEDVCRAPQEAVDKIASLVGLDAPARCGDVGPAADEIGGGEYRRPYNNCNCGGFNCYSNCNCNCACACDCNCACGDG